MLAAACARRPLTQVCRRAIGTASTRRLPSAAYTDPSSSKSGGPDVSDTPADLTEQQRSALDAALRVDQAGEIAANYIYMGQLAVLGKDPVTKDLIQVRATCRVTMVLLDLTAWVGNVGSGKEAPRCHEQAASSAQCSTDITLGCGEGRWVWVRCRNRTLRKGSCDGLYRSS